MHERYPELSDSQVSLVLEGLRLWLLACLHANGSMLGMPFTSRRHGVAHEFILMTRHYHAFCDDALGNYLHHSPSETLDEPLGEAMARTLRVIERHSLTAGPVVVAAGIPLLFSIDGDLDIEGGYAWSAADLEGLRRRDGDGGGGAGGGGGSSDSDGAGDAGCGGGGCGGGCGGG